MSLAVYKILHLTGIFFTFAALGGLSLRAVAGGSSERARKLAAWTHGAAMLVILVSGFGALARLGLGSFPPWVWGKLAIWLLLGAAMVVLRKKPSWGKLFWWLLPLLGTLAAYLALYKPV